MAVAKKRGRGRPKLPEKDKKKSATVSLSMTPELRDQLVADQIRNGKKSVNKEIVDRLKHTLSQGGYIDHWVFGEPTNHNLMRLIGMMTRNIWRAEGDELWTNPVVHQDFKDAIITVLDAFGPDGKIPSPNMNESAGQRRGRSWLEQVHRAKQLPDRLPDERTTPDGEYIDFTTDERALVEIWKGLGSLGNKLENDNE
jgi:hypothetical protein